MEATHIIYTSTLHTEKVTRAEEARWRSPFASFQKAIVGSGLIGDFGAVDITSAESLLEGLVEAAEDAGLAGTRFRLVQLEGAEELQDIEVW